MHSSRSLRRLGVATIGAAALVASLTLPATAGQGSGGSGQKLADQLVRKADGKDANRHLIAFQRIADSNGGNRASNTPGYDASVEYVAGKLRKAGFKVTTPEYTYEEEVAVANDVTVGGTAFEVNKLDLSPDTPVGGLTAPLVAVPQDATPGCEATDFAGLPVTGGIAVIRRGACTFEIKANNAAAAGAIGVVIANNVPDPLVNVTLGNPGTIPVGGASGTATPCSPSTARRLPSRWSTPSRPAPSAT